MFKLIKICIAVFIIISVSTIISLSIYKSVPTVNSNEGTELPIIMYHSILKNSDLAGKYIITPSQLVNDIEYLEENGYTTISAKELIDFIDNGTDLPEKPVMLTFDDGCYNNYEYALPILEKHSEHGIFCIVGQYTDDYTETNEANTNYGYMRWIDVFNLSTSKYAEIANHSYNFHQYNQGRAGSKKKAYESAAEYKNIFKNDTEKLQNECISHLKFAPVIYAYPF